PSRPTTQAPRRRPRPRSWRGCAPGAGPSSTTGRTVLCGRPGLGRRARDGGMSEVAGGCGPAGTGRAPLGAMVVRVARLHRVLAGQLLREVGLHVGQELV